MSHEKLRAESWCSVSPDSTEAITHDGLNYITSSHQPKKKVNRKTQGRCLKCFENFQNIGETHRIPLQ